MSMKFTPTASSRAGGSPSHRLGASAPVNSHRLHPPPPWNGSLGFVGFHYTDPRIRSRQSFGCPIASGRGLRDHWFSSGGIGSTMVPDSAQGRFLPDVMGSSVISREMETSPSRKLEILSRLLEVGRADTVYRDLHLQRALSYFAPLFSDQ